MKYFAEILVIGALILWVSAYMAAPGIDSGTWFLLDAAAKVCICGAVAVLITGNLSKTTANVLFVLSVSNLLDELFFNPEVTSTNEYVFGFAVLIYALYKILYGRSE